MAAKDTSQLNSELAKLRDSGLILPKNPFRAVQAYGESVQATREMGQIASVDLARTAHKLGRPITNANYDSPEVQRILQSNKALANAMGDQRRMSHGGLRRTAGERASAQNQRWASTTHQAVVGGSSNSMGGDVLNAIPRFYDPLEYWDLSGLPWNVADEGHRHKLHKWLRLYYATHYLVPILVDIFTRFPLVGLELQHEDQSLKEIYEEVFLNQLQYEDFLVSLGREVWLVGEAFPLGSFVETLGIWEHEGLINPEDVVIDNFPLLDSRQLKIAPPDYLRRIVQTQTPPREWYQIQQNYEDLIPYLLKGEHIPMSPVIMGQVANKLNDWDDHGTPILLRGLRTLLHEEKLLASQDAIAERLYSPFLLAKLGIMDMGDGLPPWLPTAEELDSVRDDIDVAMAADFRVMVHHFGLELSSVFGREQMPRLGDDFDRIERRLMQVFGVNPSLLSAGSNSQPYASSALQAEFMNQILRTFQKQLKEHFHQRAMVMAEAQGHFAYERRGQTRVQIFETVMEPDAEGNLQPVRKPKYTCPELNFATFDLRDEATERQFLQALRMQGVPIPDSKLMIGVSWKDEDFVTEAMDDIKYKTIAQQQAKMDTYLALVIKGLPVPMDLKSEVESVLAGGTGPTPPPGGEGGGGGAPPPGGGEGGPGGPGGPQAGGMVMPPPPSGLLGPGAGQAPPGGGPPPTAPNEASRGNVPEASNERRPGLTYNASVVKVGEELDFEELSELVKDWPEPWRKRAAQIWSGAPVTDALENPGESQVTAATLSPGEVENDPSTWTLRPYSKVEEKDGKPIIVEGGTRALSIPVEEGKRYSLVDPLATDLKEPIDTHETASEESESPGSLGDDPDSE